MVQTLLMNHKSSAIGAVKLLCLIAFLCPLGTNAHGESNARESQQRLKRTDLLFYRDSKGDVYSVKSVRDFQKRRAEILRAMTEVMGPLPGKDKRCPLDPRVEEEVDCGDYVRRFLSYATEP